MFALLGLTEVLVEDGHIQEREGLVVGEVGPECLLESDETVLVPGLESLEVPLAVEQ